MATRPSSAPALPAIPATSRPARQGDNLDGAARTRPEVGGDVPLAGRFARPPTDPDFPLTLRRTSSIMAPSPLPSPKKGTTMPHPRRAAFGLTLSLLTAGTASAQTQFTIVARSGQPAP